MLTKDFEVIDKRFEKLVFGNVHLEKLYTGTRWAEGPAYFPAVPSYFPRMSGSRPGFKLASVQKKRRTRSSCAPLVGWFGGYFRTDS